MRLLHWTARPRVVRGASVAITTHIVRAQPMPTGRAPAEINVVIADHLPSSSEAFAVVRRSHASSGSARASASTPVR